MSVPKTTVNEDDLPFLPKYEVGTSWQIARMEPVSISERKDEPTHGQLRTSVLPPDERHSFRTFLRRKTVHTRYSVFGEPNSGHLSAMYFSAASRTTQANETFFSFAITSKVS